MFRIGWLATCSFNPLKAFHLFDKQIHQSSFSPAKSILLLLQYNKKKRRTFFQCFQFYFNQTIILPFSGQCNQCNGPSSINYLHEIPYQMHRKTISKVFFPHFCLKPNQCYFVSNIFFQLYLFS